MIRRSGEASGDQAALEFQSWSRPLPMKIAGRVLLVGAAFLILGGAYRAQSNMITSGLLFVAMGVAFAPDTLRLGWPLRIAIVALAIVGGVFAFLT